MLWYKVKKYYGVTRWLNDRKRDGYTHFRYAEDNAQQLTLSCIRQYKKNLMIADNQEVIELSKQLEGLAEDDPKRIELNKQIDDIIRPILTKKE